MFSYQIPGVQTLPGEKKTRFEDWLSNNNSFRFYAQGKAPELDVQKARTKLFKRIGEKETAGKQGNTIPLNDLDNETVSRD